MMEEIDRIASEIEQVIIAYRRDFHRHAESGWTEFRTASLVARRLVELGYEVQIGREVIHDGERQGLPPAEVLEETWQRACAQGGAPEFLEQVRGGYTGVVGTLRCGPGPTIGLRFDMDAIELAESLDPDHRPAREGFASVNPGANHACGHDGHTAVGLGVAEVLTRLQAQIQGTVKLIFQPAEEGVRGARAMVAAGVVDDVDYLLGFHLYSGWDVGQIDPGRSGFLATTKFDAYLHGLPAHAGGVPNQGKNALMAAATAVLNLQAIPRHRDGKTRINVGRLVAGSGRNVVPATAHLVIETRGATTELNSYMFDNAVRILEAAAAMHDCSLEIKAMGSAHSADSDGALMARVRDIVLETDDLLIRDPEPSGGSEDFTFMMRRVQERGGLATNIGIGADLGGWGHHTAEFDLDERALRVAVRLLSAVVLDIFEAPIL
ncbi:MAG: amidohydrolase [Anaerolineae bacterium]|jgi:aminobenzoyl-glutamate utilization protein A